MTLVVDRPGESLLDVQHAQQCGQTSFMGLTLWLERGTLMPRSETALLGETAVSILKADAAAGLRVLDMCCGVGNLALAVATQVHSAQVWAADLTQECVRTARRNVDRYGLEQRVNVLQGDLFGALAGLGLEGSLDMIVCNPPYISTGRLNATGSELLGAEPREAFDAGPFGLAIHQRLVREAPSWLKAGGQLLFEFGVGQGRQVKLLLERMQAYTDVALIPDAQGQPRVARAMRST